AAKVVATNEKLYVNRKEGFVGTSLKKDEFVAECSDIDDIIVFLKDGRYLVTKVADKIFVGLDIIHVGIFKKNDDRTIYNVIYQDGKNGSAMIKRFAVTGVTRDKEYHVGKNTPDSRILYLTANPNGEAEIVRVNLKPQPRLRKPQFEVDFSKIAIKGRGSMGNILSRRPVSKVILKEDGISTLGGRNIWFDHDVSRLNADSRGQYIGEFSGDDKVAAITKSGNFRLHSFDLTTHFEADVLIVEKFDPEKIYTAVYFDGEQGYYYVKRFHIEPTEKLISFIGDHPESKLATISGDDLPRLMIKYKSTRKKNVEEILDAAEFIAVKGCKARGRRISTTPIVSIELLEPVIKEEEFTGVTEAETGELTEAIPEQEIDEVDETKQEPTEIQKSLFDFPMPKN
ncbi:MAG: DNA gyrase/topoisomerase IV subunit A, partial [Acidobacteria bacterium]|nr:DNA gyrase/topoisomerase IV subunit A [Acidobacteriota bacterium]